MRSTLFAAFCGLAIAVAGCQPTAAPQTNTPTPKEEWFGTLGSVKAGLVGKELEGRGAQYREGDLLAYIAVSKYPGRKLEPAFLLMVRLAPKVAVFLGPEMSCDGRELIIAPYQRDSKNEIVKFAYTVGGDPLAEGITAHGKSWKVQDGRVFLLDLTAEPPKLTQVKREVNDLLPDASRDVTKDEVKAAVAKVAGDQEQVKAFIAKAEAK